MKFKKELVAKAKFERNNEKIQEQLREKYNVDSNTVIIEKNNSFKFIIKVLLNCLHLVANIIFFFLSFIGIVSIILPATRYTLYSQFSDACTQLIGWIIN